MPRRGEYTSALCGERFGRLVVIAMDGKSRRCRCDCGAEITVDNAYHLKTRNTSSCGCLRDDCTRARFTKHGATANHTSTRAYHSWAHMRGRCLNPRNAKWPRYGGRGITICDRWLESFAHFLADMGEPPPGHSIDRIDNDGPYSPENCRWADDPTQGSNRSSNHRLTYLDETLTLQQWAKRLGMSSTTIRYRLRQGWSVERAFFSEVS